MVKENKKGREEQLNPQAMFGHRETLMEAFDYAKMMKEDLKNPIYTI